MTTTTSSKNATSAKQQFLDAFQREHATTMRVLRAFPKDKLDLKPHERTRSARELAFIFVMEQALGEKALTTGFDWSKPPSGMPAAPDSLDAIIEAFDQAHKRTLQLVNDTGEDELLNETVQFFTAPGTISDVQKLDFLWFLLHDQIHHRGQFSIYLRMAGGKVPAIYGPSGDEPFF